MGLSVFLLMCHGFAITCYFIASYFFYRAWKYNRETVRLNNKTQKILGRMNGMEES